MYAEVDIPPQATKADRDLHRIVGDVLRALPGIRLQRMERFRLTSYNTLAQNMPRTKERT